MNKRISVCGKGGSGKSTVVALLAQELSVRDWRVIVVDSDESNACIHWMLGFEHPPRPLLELVGGKKSVQKQMRKTYSDGRQFRYGSPVTPCGCCRRPACRLSHGERRASPHNRWQDSSGIGGLRLPDGRAESGVFEEAETGRR